MNWHSLLLEHRKRDQSHIVQNKSKTSGHFAEKLSKEKWSR
jgi:hypothetical protein